MEAVSFQHESINVGRRYYPDEHYIWLRRISSMNCLLLWMAHFTIAEFEVDTQNDWFTNTNSITRYVKSDILERYTLKSVRNYSM